MSLHELAQQSGLAFALSDDDTSHTPQWNACDWPPVVDGWRCGHASVVLDIPENDCAQTVVVLGGRTKYAKFTNSTLLLNLNEENIQWREGPPLNQRRRGHTAVVCNGGVYAMGGNGSGFNALKCIERIDVEDLLEASCVASRNRKQWTTLNCRLSTSRRGCCAVTVYNRYIVVIGGFNHNNSYLSSVDIIDTAIQSNHTIISGPSMKVPRGGCASVVIDHRIFVVGGHNSPSLRVAATVLGSVETLQFEKTCYDETKETACTVFPSSAAWTTCTDLTISTTRYPIINKAVAVGSCIVVGGGRYNLELLDTERNIVWNLPTLTTGRSGYSMVAFNNGIAVVGGWKFDSCETCEVLSLTVRSTRYDDSCVSENVFYNKLVEVECDDIVFKVHDLALLVSDVYQMKVFYIFLNHLYRSKRISKDERQRYTMKALQETFSTIQKTDQQALTMQDRIVEKCRQDGILVSGFDNHETDSVAAITDPMSSLPNKLAMTEFRVGKILPHTSTQSSATTNTASESIGHRVVLAQAQALGRSLKEVYSALDAKDANQASTGVTCSILNALSFGQTIFRDASCETLATCVLDEIVDYGDVNHICLVVSQSSNEKLQNAVQQGIAIVEGAKLSLDATREQDKAGMSVLVSVMGQLANAVTKWIRKVTPMEVDVCLKMPWQSAYWHWW